MYSLRAKWFWICVSLLLLSMITYLSLLPSQQLPDLGVSDKVLHLVAYFCLTVWFVGFIKTQWYWIVGSILLGFSYGIEVLQGMSRWRQFDWYDLLANGIGIFLALLLGLLLLQGWSQRFERYVFKHQQ